MVLQWGVMVSTHGGLQAPDVCQSLCKSKNSICNGRIVVGPKSAYSCQCQTGYSGNPYVAGGCQDINECELPQELRVCFGDCTNTDGGFECWCPRGTHGNHTIPRGCVPSITGLSIGIGVGSGVGIILLVVTAIFMARRLKYRRAKKMKQKFFKQNRGQLLQQLVSQRADIAERMIIPVDEIVKATNNFDRARKLGGGGHGTVYKGILSDLHVVAIKKSNVADQREIDDFINEVAILSQINHRNVVKLFGCCLETEVPLLVYEFVSNGTLHNHLHVTETRSLPWNDRLRIAREIAKAIAYLHSAVSIPIIHRDIKSANILLDDTLTSKVSDFGASRHVPIDRSEIVTKLQGTIGYMDPSYYYTCQLTEKSDVYSFGVIVIELLTRKKPTSYLSSEDEGLVAHFVSLFTSGELVEILDWQVLEEGGKQIEEVAELAATCVNMDRDCRPTMTQVEMALESIQAKEPVLDRLMAVRPEENNIRRRSPSDPEGGNVDVASRVYSLEEEFLLSARYPR
ncbi:unnamed protein product [Urochloa humidicola]